MKNENDVKAEVKRLLDAHGWFSWHAGAGPYSYPGVSDRLALKNGHFLAVECKFSDKHGSNAQERFGHDVMQGGGLYFTVNAARIPQFRDWLEAFDLDNKAAAK